MPDEQPVPPQPANHRTALTLAIAIPVAIIAIFLCYHFFLTKPAIDPDDAATQDVVKLIYADAPWFHTLWVRWTAIDWLLTFLATGTAVGAVIKNNYSVQAAPNTLSFLDKFLIVMAVLTVLATTFDGKLHASQLAAQYRRGNLILQKAEIDYAASDKSQAAKDALRLSWHQAEDGLSASDPSNQPPSATKPTIPSANQPGAANATPNSPSK